MKNKLFLLPLFTFFMFACTKDIAIAPHDKGGIQVGASSIGEKYHFQSFFQLSTNKVVATNSKFLWDLAFENGPDGKHIVLNSSKNMYLYTTNETSLNDVTSISPYQANKTMESPSLNLDSTAFGDWTNNKVRILDLGLDENNNSAGIFKIKILQVTSTSYTFEFASIDATSYQTVTLAKTDQQQHNFVHYSLVNQQIITVYPALNTWDLLATQYTEWVYNPGEGAYDPYLVTGILINRFNGTKAIKVLNKSFEDVDLSFAVSLNLSDKANTIGYDWKYLSGGFNSSYVVHSDYVYVIQDHNEIYYKLRFIDFYDENGVKGTPTFEFQELGAD